MESHPLISMADVVFDEFFFYLFNQCQARAFFASKTNYISKLDDYNENIKKSYRFKKYTPDTEDTFMYLILKKIYYKAFSVILSGKDLTLEEYKQISIAITEKECLSNKKKVKKYSTYYDKVKEKIFKTTEENFLLINEYDVSESIDSFISIKANLKEYLELNLKRINPIYRRYINWIDWSKVNGEPKFLLNIISLKKDKNGISIIMTSPYYIDRKMVHQNFYISFIIQFIYYLYPIENKLEMFGKERPNIDKLIMYYPLQNKREEYTFRDINGKYQDAEMFNILQIFLNGYYVKTSDTRRCEHCENKDYCFHRTNAKNKTAKKFILNNELKEVKDILI